jgi:hypothetical protein
MADAITISAAKRHYKRNSPLHGSSRQHKADLEAISKSTQPNSKADTLITQRQADTIERKVEMMLIKQQGRRKRFTYNQSAVIGLEHLVDGPLDPQTQAPLWHNMIRRSKGIMLTKADFMAGARTILNQTSLYDPMTMAG